MKKFYFLMLFLSMNTFSMPILESFILTNDGTKIYIKPNSFKIDNRQKMVYYKSPNSDIDGKIKFKDFDYVLIGANKFKTYKINKLNESIGYFVLAESISKTFIFTTIPNDDEDSSKIKYVMYVLDEKGAILDGLEFDNLKNPKSINVRAEIFSKIQFYFNDCDNLMTRIRSYNKLSGQNGNMSVLDFFDSPVYIECQN